jgi:hypothetical protein
MLRSYSSPSSPCLFCLPHPTGSHPQCIHDGLVFFLFFAKYIALLLIQYNMWNNMADLLHLRDKGARAGSFSLKV